MRLIIYCLQSQELGASHLGMCVTARTLVGHSSFCMQYPKEERCPEGRASCMSEPPKRLQPFQRTVGILRGSAKHISETGSDSAAVSGSRHPAIEGGLTAHAQILAKAGRPFSLAVAEQKTRETNSREPARGGLRTSPTAHGTWLGQKPRVSPMNCPSRRSSVEPRR